MPAAEIPVLGKAAHVDVVRIEGKASFACDIGDLIRVRYTNKNPVTKTEQALVGKIFVGQVVRFYKEPAKRIAGKIVDRGGKMMMRIKWKDAPADYIKVCKDTADDFDEASFKASYTILRAQAAAAAQPADRSSSSSSNALND